MWRVGNHKNPLMVFCSRHEMKRRAQLAAPPGAKPPNPFFTTSFPPPDNIDQLMK
jgi:hypothetical protein